MARRPGRPATKLRGELDPTPTPAELLALAAVLEEGTIARGARRIGRSHHTLETLLVRLRQRLGVRSYAAAARRLGWRR